MHNDSTTETVTVKGFPLSRQQQFLLKQHANWPERALSCCVLIVDAAVARSRIADCLTQLVARHEALRIQYYQETTDVAPIQVIADPYAVNVEESSVNTANFANDVDFLQVQVATNAESDTAKHTLHLALPCMSIDSVSWSVLVSEFNSLLNAEALYDDEDVVQYIDFADWQDEVIDEDDDAREFWQKHWGDNERAAQLSLTRLPGERAKSDVHSAENRVFVSVSEAVKATHLRASFAWLLGQWLGHESIAYNLVANGRLTDDFADGIGAYQRQLPCYVGLSGLQTVDDLLTAIEADDELLLANQMSMPLQLVQPLYTFHELPASHTSHAATIESIVEQQNHNSLTLAFSAETKRVELAFCAHTWDAHWVASLVEMIASTAECFTVSEPNSALTQLTYLPAEKLQALHDQFNSHQKPENNLAVSTSLLSQLCVHAEKTPDAIAVSDANGTRTYAQLITRVAQNAQAWQKAGLQSGQCVAIHAHREIALVEAVLSVLVCGAHYVAVDTALPTARKQWLIARSDYWVSLAQDSVEQVKSVPLATQLLASSLSEDTTKPPEPQVAIADALSTLRRIDDQQDAASTLAYILFTSGSTGEPKGVQISWQALNHYLSYAADTYCADIDLSLVHTSIGFDLTVTSLFAPLWAGKQVHMVSEGSIGIENLTRALEVSAETAHTEHAPRVLLKLTPAHLKAMATWVVSDAAKSSNLTRLVVGGEALSAADVACFFEQYPNIHIINEYGPTEATVGCSIHSVSPQDKGNICIGQPIARMGFYVLDEQQCLVAPGMAGELYIAGQGLANGYDNLAQVTAERFVYSTELAQRLYKTGDLVRLVAEKDGYYEFLGRNDRQVKVRGYRIELEEIEASIKQHLPCSDAVVLSRENQHQVTELVAYLQTEKSVEASGNKPMSADQLAELLQPHLPDYMQPTQWVVLADFPLTVNGKVDIKALPELASQQQQAYVAPSTELEQQLVEIWQNALNVERIGVQDNFFSLGGDSIRGVHVVALSKAAGLNLSIQQVFSAKTISALAELLNNSADSTHVEDVSEQYVAFSMISDTDKQKLPENIEDAYPLGTVQLGMLYDMHSTRDANTPPDYHNVASFRLRFDHTFQPELFQQAVDRVVAVEPYLRASFDLSNYSQPLQMIQREAKLTVGYHDWRGSSTAEADLEAFVKEENFRLIDTACAPLMRLRVHHFADDLISLSLTEPHSLADGWSTHLTLIDIFAAYIQLIDGQPITLEPVKTRYSEFVKAEQETIASEESREFWKTQIDKAVITELPPKAEQTHEEQLGEHRHRLKIPTEIFHGLTQVAQLAKVPVKSVLLAAHMRLLALLSGETTITSGLNFNGRLETDDGIKVRGLFLNMLPVTLDLTGGSWVELAQAAHQAEIDILPHRRYPLGLLLSDFGKDKLFDSALSFLHFHSLATDFEGAEQRVISEGIIDHSKTNYDFNAVFDRDPFDPDSLTYIGDANLDRFTRAQLDEFLNFYVTILRDIAEHPQDDYRRTHYLSDEQLSVLTRWQQGTTVTQSEVITPVVQQFEALAMQSPEQLAILDEQSRPLSYQALNTLATQYAQALRVNGVKAGDFVALHLPRCVDAVASILALHKLGAAYIPLETSYPMQRINDVLEDSQAAFIISNAEGLALSTQATQLRITDLHVEIPEATEFPRVDGTAIAYVLYTSGSTGKPKGVKISQAALSDYITWAAQQYVADAQTPSASALRDLPSLIFPLFSPLSFDLTVTSVFTPLVTGGAIAVYHSEDAAGLIEQIVADNRVDIIKMTPAHLALLQVLSLKDWQVTRIIVGGEQLQGQLAKSITDAMPNVRIFNEYGPTETTVGCTVYEFNPHTDASQAVPIGIPAHNTQAIVLDAFGLPVPVGVKGELFIAGNGVADGYVARDQLNAERFVTLPQLGDVRAYRTGDVVRWRNDGQLVFVGRMDDQVKIRGYRIELGEVESVIANCADVAQTIVDVEGQGQDSQLIAYIVRQVNTELDAAALREHCSQQLPDYMLPARSVFVPHLPLTANGKIDRKQLNLLLADTNADSDIVLREYVAPRNKTEQILCEIWQESLKCERIGINDNFFELGGHSIQALHLIPTIQDRLNARLSLTAFLKNPTIKSVAEQLASQQDTVAEPEETLPKIGFDQQNLHLPFPLTPVQQAYFMGRSSVFELGNVATHSYIEFEWENMDVALFQACFNRLVQRHDMLRAVFSEQGEQQILTDIREYPIRYDDYSALSEIEKDEVLLNVRDELSHQVLPIDRWPLFDLRISRMNDSRCRVHFSMDALLADAMSFDIIDHELTEMYLQGTDIELPPISTSFRDYVLAEQALHTTNLFKKAKEYWVERLDTLPEAPQLPLAKQPSEILHPTFERRHFRLEKSLWSALQKQASQLGVTPTVMVLTLFSAVLRQWSKNNSFTLNLTLFNRLPLHEHVNHLIGDFTSLTLLQIDTYATDTMRSAAQRIQQQLWNDLEHRIFGGMDVLRALNAHEGRMQAANMPIVFSSTLGLNEGADQEEQLDVEPTFSITQTPQVWLDHQVTEEFGELVLSWDAIGALFPQGMLDDMFATYTQLVTRVAKGESVDFSYLGLPSTHEAIYRDYNATQQDVVSALSVSQEQMFLHTPFLQQVRKQPDAVAVISSECTLTYAQLHQHASAVAEQLLQQDVKAGELVAVVMEKGWQQVVAVLGVLYAGGAYLPVDAHQPRKRLEQVLALGESRCSLIQQANAKSLNWLAETQTVINVDDCLQASTDIDPTAAIHSVTQLAYVIFTSGSTGTPKGVMIDHRGAVNTCLDINARYGIDANDRVLAISALNFDLSVYDIFGLLAAGGAMVVPDIEKEKDPHHWASLVQQHQVTLWNSVPAIAHLLIEEVQKSPDALAIPSLKTIMMSGDWIPLELPEDARSIRPDIELISMGGATEASIWSIYFPIAAVQPHWRSIPYGRPLANQGFHVFNAQMQPCPLWVAGELYISGIGLAQGYWKDAERTAASFVTHPKTGECFYRTGDLGRFLPDGNIEFLGREDNQVKLHGHRVELGEVEAVIALQPQVKNAAVIVHTSETNQKHLLAYVVPDDTESEEADSVIDDALEFKLAQHGLLAYDDQSQVIDLALSHALSLPKHSVMNPASTADCMLTKAQLGQWLSVLSSHRIEGQALPKRHYPSAGSLYPVRTWLVLPSSNTELSQGCYYYDPETHRLVLSDNDKVSAPEAVTQLLATSTTATLFFQALPEAMQPIYGGNTERFIALEIGHMFQLLQDAGSVLGLVVSEVPNAENSDFVAQIHGCSAAVEAHELITLNINQRQSIREFVQRDISLSQLNRWLKVLPWDEANQHVTACLYLRPGMVSDGEGGYYRYDPAEQSLIHVCDDESARGYTLFGDNQAIEREASFSLYFISDSTADTWHTAGAFGQSLMQQAARFDIGICPIGKVHQSRLKLAKLTDDEHPVIYAFEGGIVHAHAYERWPSLADTSDAVMQEIYKDELRVRLPYYMIPDFFMVMDELPLTANGKIDRKSLPIPEFAEVATESFVAPADAIEQHLWQFCSNNLQAEQISCAANLLELGADSLFAIRFVSEVRVAFGVEMNLRAFFEHASIQAMAEIIRQEDGQLSASVSTQEFDTADHEEDEEMEEGTL